MTDHEESKCQQDKKCLDALNAATQCVNKCIKSGGKPDACATQCQSHVLGNSNTLNLVLCGIDKCNTTTP